MSRRDELVDAAVDHVTEHGFADLSFRSLAEGLGIAHNSLTHHFGTRAGLVTAIFQRLSERSRQQTLPEASSPAELVLAAWSDMSTPEKQRFWLVFFEFWVTALRDPASHRDFLDHATRAWLEPLVARAGGDPTDPDALAEATLLVATFRGLVLDLLSGADRDRVDRAVQRLAQRYSDL